MSALRVAPVSLREVRALVDRLHRHHTAPQGHTFSVGVTQDGQLVGVAIVGRPVARRLDDGHTLDVTRVATDGTANACSMLYATSRRAARALGFRRLITYTQHPEPGTSLRAAGWRPIANRPPRPGWDRPGRRRRDTGTAHVARTLWQAPR